MAEQSKEKVDEAIETLVSHYGRGICKWLVKKFPKTTKALATGVIFLVGGFMLYFVIGISGQDPIDFIFDNIGKEITADEEKNTDSQYQDDSTNSPSYKDNGGWVTPVGTNISDVIAVTEDPTGKIVNDENGNTAVWVKEEKK